MDNKKLQALRAKMKKSQLKNQYFADKLGVSIFTLSHAIRGRRTGKIYDELLIKIEKLLK